MLPALLLAAAAPLAQLAGEEIAKLIAGDDPATVKKGAAVAEALVNAAGVVTGIQVTPANAQEVAAMLDADPQVLADFRAKLGDQLVTLLTLDNEDRASARGQTVALTQAGSRIAWGAPVVSTIVLVIFGVVLYRVLNQPPGQVDQNGTLMLGALTTMATAVVSYWVGSSAGSAAKDKLLAGGR